MILGTVCVCVCVCLPYYLVGALVSLSSQFITFVIPCF